jgi:hypothetical protein
MPNFVAPSSTLATLVVGLAFIVNSFCDAQWKKRARRALRKKKKKKKKKPKNERKSAPKSKKFAQLRNRTNAIHFLLLQLTPFASFTVIVMFTTLAG